MNTNVVTDRESWPGTIGAIVRFLTFRASREDLRIATWKHLVVTLLGVWMAGVGRWWDSPQASLLQKSGVGSIVYIIFLSFFLWIFFHFSTGGKLKYHDSLLVVSMTGPVAFIYAIPVERFTDFGSAAAANGIALLVVSVYRISLLWFYLRVGWGMNRYKTFANVFTPISMIVGVFSAFQLFTHALTVMSGIRTGVQVTSAESIIASFSSLLLYASPLVFLVGLVMYIDNLPFSDEGSAEGSR